MRPNLVFTLLAAISTAAAVAQTAGEQAADVTPATSSTPLAFVYVSRPTHVDGFAASSNGKLTPVPGSPFANIKVGNLSVNKKFLFGSGDDGEDIYTFSIASNGSIKQVAKTNANTTNPEECGGLSTIAIDTTGTTVYGLTNTNCDDAIQSFRIESNGDLQYLGTASSGIDTGVDFLSNLHVAGTGKFAYQVGYGADFDRDPRILRYKHESNGLLVSDGLLDDLPKTKNPEDYYTPQAFAPDGSNHLAMALLEVDPNGTQYPPMKLASFSVDSSGNVTTKSTYENMPSTNMQVITTMSISPSGKYLAVGSLNGFQIFHFDGSGAITKLTTILQPQDTVNFFAWDKDDHLYALATNTLYVYNMTSTTVKQATGSPYSIPEASGLIVLSK
jgi:hypothetical protein